jgi:hypothetical protein
MALVSPGLSVTVTDESQYVSNSIGSTPLILLATAENKTINGAVAAGTAEVNAGQLQIFTSQGDLSNNMGYPIFQQSSAGTPLHGNELNEYGLMAAYSSLGLINQAYVIRADIDLNELQPTSVRPSQPVSSGTVWFDTADTTWGIYEWSQSSQSFVEQTPIIITTAAQVTTANTQGVFAGGSGYAYTPLSSVGTIGQYAVVAYDNDNRVYYKAGNSVSSTNVNGLYNTWVLVGTPNWHASHPTVTGTVTNPTLTTSNVFINNQRVTVTISGSYSMSNVANAINSTSTVTSQGITADVVNGYLNIYSNGTNSLGGNVVIAPDPNWNSASNVALMNAVGLTAGTYTTTLMQATTGTGSTQPSGTNPSSTSTVGFGSYTAVPPWTDTVAGDLNAPNGSVWLKTGATGGGSNFVFKQYNSTTALWSTLSVNAYSNEQTALFGLDPLGGGLNIPTGTIYMKEDPNTYNTAVLGYAGWNARVRSVSGAVSATGSTLTPTFSAGLDTMTLQVTVPGSTTVAQATIIVNGGNGAAFVSAVLGAGLPNLTAQVNANGSITMTHTAGGSIFMVPTNPSYDTPANAGFVSGTTNVTILGSQATGVTLISGFSTLSNYSISTTSPVADPANGTLWYYSDPTQVDIMINTGSKWVGYQTLTADARGYNLTQCDPNGVIVSAGVAPTTQTDGSALVSGDLWLDSSNLENWPALSRYNGSSWVAIDNTDHISVNGVVFADARWDNSGTNDPASGTEISVQTLLTSSYLDLDAPNPLLYPRGMMLFNTRRSGYNVKKFVTNYFNTASDNVSTYSASTNYKVGSIVLYGTTLYVATTVNGPSTSVQAPSTNSTYWSTLQTSSWVTASGLNTETDVPYSGHYAQRQIVVAALRSALNSNTQILESQYASAYNLITCPGYPELIPDMVNLNNNITNTAFVIGDTPMNLSTSITDITNWSTDVGGTGLATDDPYLAVYYPSGLSSDLGGNTIMVPASHMALRTYLYNDNVAYPWFAPAGTRRGLVGNATDLGYVDYTSGEFVHNGVNNGLRDALYQNNINPITILPGIGIVIWGQKTRDPNTESMDRVNVARLVNYVRSIFANAGNAFLFEPNDQITRQQFAAVLNRALNDLVAKRGIYDYLVVCDETNNTSDIIANNELYADVAIEPMKSVEFIYIPIRLYNPGDIAALGSQ